MSWILNRPGQQPEGPYDEGQLLHMIRSGHLKEGFICPAGSQQWMPLNVHPPFARALAEGPSPGQQRLGGGTLVMQADPSGVRAGSWNDGGARPSADFSAGPVAGPAPGAPPPGWGGAAQALPLAAEPRGPAPAKPRRVGLWLGLALLPIALIGIAAVAIFVFAGSGSRLSRFVPDDVLAFVEFPDSVTALETALGVDFLNPLEVDAKKQLDTAVKALTDTFGVEKAAAEKLVLGIQGGAFALRRNAGDEQAAVLVSFRDAGVVEPWLESNRVTKEGKFGSGGERYFVSSSKEPPPEGASPMNQAFAAMSVAKGTKAQALVWFESEAILAMGHTDLLDDIDSVIIKGEGSLAESTAFKGSNFDDDATVIGLLSADVLDEVKGEEPRKFIQGYLNDIAPFTLEASFVDAGLLTRLRAQLKGNRITADEALPNAIELELPERLPTGTIGYIAVGSERSEDGKAMRNRLIKQIRATDESAADEFEAALGQFEQTAGLGFEQLLDAIGSEMVFGLVVDAGFKLGKETPATEQLDQVAALWITQVGKEDAAADVAKRARIKLFEEGPLAAKYVIKQQGLGFQALPNDPKLPIVQVFFHEGSLLVGVGGKQVLVRALLALGGKESLASDEAHQKAVRAMGKRPRLLGWVDSGRIGKTTLAGLSEEQKRAMDEVERQLGVSHEAIRLEGDDRITAAIALHAESDGDVWNASLETLNAPALGLLSVLPSLVAPQPPPPPTAVLDPTVPTVPGLFLPQTGVSQCDGYVLVMFQCGERTTDATMSAEARALEQRLKGESADPARRASLGQQCSQDLLKFMLQNQKCTGG